MPTTKTESIWKKFIPTVKDVIYIILFLATAYGWIRSETKKASDKDNKIENLTKAVDSNTKQLEKISDMLMKQAEINGKMMLHIETDHN
jgi:hypothetical protein